MNGNIRFWIFTILIALGVGIMMYFYLQKKEKEEIWEIQDQEMNKYYQQLPQNRQRTIQEIGASICDCVEQADPPAGELTEQLTKLRSAIENMDEPENAMLLHSTALKDTEKNLTSFMDCAGIEVDMFQWDCLQTIQPNLNKKKRPLLLFKLIHSHTDCSSGRELLRATQNFIEILLLKDVNM